MDPARLVRARGERSRDKKAGTPAFVGPKSCSACHGDQAAALVATGDELKEHMGRVGLEALTLFQPAVGMSARRPVPQ